MNRMTSTWAAIFCAAGLALGAVSMTTQNPPPPVDGSTLHPERSIVFLQWDGSHEHAEAIKNTAQYQALVKSGLFDYGTKLLKQSLPALMAQAGGPRGAQEEMKTVQELLTYVNGIFENGFSFSITDGTGDGLPAPVATLVLNGFAGNEATLEQLLQLMDIPGDEAQMKLISGRSVKTLIIPRTPGFELSWFSESDHLVIAVGPDAAGSVIRIANGESANVKSSDAWKTYREVDPGFEVASIAWIQFGALIDRFGGTPLPIPQVEGPRSVNDFIDALGLQNLKHAATQFGYKNEACMTRTYIVAPGPKTGLLKLTQQPTFTIDDLPPIPPTANAFLAFGLDAGGAYDTTMETIDRVLALLPQDASEQFAQGKQMLDGILGLDIRDDLLAGLGDVHCVYSDPSGGFFGLGFGVAFQVADATKLEQSLNHLANLIQGQLEQQSGPVQFGFQRSVQEGHRMLTLPASVWAPTVSVSENWMVLGIQPQAVRTFFMREAGTLPKWTPTAEHQAAFAMMPSKFSSLAVDDPRASVNALYNFVPMFNSVVHTIAPTRSGRNSVTAADLPPAAFVTAPLFANVAMGVPSENGIEYIRRQSLPISPLPSVESGAAVPVLLALLLPAVQQAREAARRTQSKNNLKQIALAMHNYHDVYNHFPAGTVEGTQLQPEQRLSFFYALLPFIEQAAIYNQLRNSEQEAWDSQASSTYTSMKIPTYEHPSDMLFVQGGTSYIGISGIGPDSAKLPNNDPKAGIFGYDRKTKIRDIIDGTSNTLMTAESTDGDIPWAQGGRTLKGFSQQPYINGPDGIGGPSPGGCNVGLADGSVRFISEHIDPSVAEALATKAGRERVGQF
ncbi:MAG: DUF1559 domain-containing protein [Fuerstiella sp.]